MIGVLLHRAARLDAWLKGRVGQPYHLLLGAGLVVDIVSRCRDLLSAPHSQATYLRLSVSVVFGVLLLLNHWAELSARIQRRAAGRGIGSPGEHS